jgi:hypothetical protein
MHSRGGLGSQVKVSAVPLSRSATGTAASASYAAYADKLVYYLGTV